MYIYPESSFVKGGNFQCCKLNRNSTIHCVDIVFISKSVRIPITGSHREEKSVT